MRGQPNRIDGPAGELVDRGANLRFTLDGRVINGFAGDTVLSAVLASGIAAAGQHQGAQVALSSRFAPAIAPAALSMSDALPMERTPALDGEEFVTVGPRSSGFFGVPIRPGASLRHRFADRATLPPTWSEGPAAATIEADLVVVGGGVAGLTAAVAAGQAGSSVILVERRQDLGGNARLFGSVEDEEAPGSIVPRLVRAIDHLDNVTVLTRTEALAIGHGGVRAHQVVAGEDGVSGRLLTLASPRVLLATGAVERLPVFAGNRLPGVTGLLEAFDLADRFGIWMGRNIALNTSTNPAYRLAMMALDAGLAVARMTDTRLGPQSRFIEFTKAYGLPFSSGLKPLSVQPHRHGGLEIRLALEVENYRRPEPVILADQFVVSGGWQPDLSLWLAAGGNVCWRRGALLAEGSLPGVVLAGAVAGYRSLSGCAQSGGAAVAALFKRTPVPVFDIEIEAIYETPDGPAAMTLPGPGDEAPAYLDAGVSLATSPEPETRKRFAFFPVRHRELPVTRPLSIGDLAASIDLGIVPESEAGAVARERCIAPDLLPRSPLPAPAAVSGYPAYLNHRFGAAQDVWRIQADEPRHFEAGNLLYPNTDATDPRGAVGVIIGSVPEEQGTAIALVGSGEADKRLVLRDLERQVSVRLVERL